MKGGGLVILLKKNTCLPDFKQEGSYLYKNIQGSQRNDHSQKDWCGKSNRKHCTNNRQKGPKKRCHRSGHHVINTTDVLGEAVHNPPLGGGLKEWHGGVHDVDQHFLMEMPRGNSWASRHCNGSTKNEESLWHAQRAINTKEQIALFVWSHISGTPLSQPDSWRDCRGLGEDEKQYDTYGDRNCERLGVFPEHWKFNLQEQNGSIWTICVKRFQGTVQAIRKLLKLSQRRQWVRCTTHVQKNGLFETLGKEPWHFSFLWSNIYLKGRPYFKKVIIYLTHYILRPVNNSQRLSACVEYTIWNPLNSLRIDNRSFKVGSYFWKSWFTTRKMKNFKNVV